MHSQKHYALTPASAADSPAAHLFRVVLTCLAAAGVTSAPSLGAQDASPPVRGAARTSQVALPGKVRTLADRLTRTDRFSGVILLAQNGSTVFEQAYGFADRAVKRRNTATTTFNVSSVGKLFSQVARFERDGGRGFPGWV